MDTDNAHLPPPQFGQAELREMVDELPEECRADVEQGYGNDWLKQAKKDREEPAPRPAAAAISCRRH